MRILKTIGQTLLIVFICAFCVVGCLGSDDGREMFHDIVNAVN